MNDYAQTARTWDSIRNHIAEGNLASHVGVVEHWSQREPFLSSGHFIGSIDYVYLDQSMDLYIRGWIFSLTDAIEDLEISIESNWGLVYGYGLGREDVVAHFPFVPQSRCSGFVYHSPKVDLSSQSIAVTFRARMSLSPDVTECGTFSEIIIQRNSPS